MIIMSFSKEPFSNRTWSLPVSALLLFVFNERRQLRFPGKGCTKTYSVEQIAEATATALRRTVPTAVPGIMFLSGKKKSMTDSLSTPIELGGLNEQNSTDYLNAINRVQAYKPWSVAFSYGRALQTSVLRAWQGETKNGELARKEFLRLIKVKINYGNESLRSLIVFLAKWFSVIGQL
jgi:fructose-bisphosphate aldolase class 1